MKSQWIAFVVTVCCLASVCAWAQTEDGDIGALIGLIPPQQRDAVIKEFYREELNDIGDAQEVAEDVYYLETALTQTRGSGACSYSLRSRHLIFGVPRLADERYRESGEPGVSLLFREGFVIGYADRLGCPIWVSQRWTRENLRDRLDTPALERSWRNDPEIPKPLQKGTSYNGSATKLDRGHMARHSMNRAWGFDSSIYGCLMSNSVPQHRSVNRGSAWRALEDAVDEVVMKDRLGIETIWTVSGAVFRDEDNPSDESPGKDIEEAAKIAGDYRVPYATYKIVGWFDDDGAFMARAYLFEQPYEVRQDASLEFRIPDQTKEPQEYIVAIDELECRTGIDFFPALKDDAERQLEKAKPTDMWGPN